MCGFVFVVGNVPASDCSVLWGRWHPGCNVSFSILGAHTISSDPVLDFRLKSLVSLSLSLICLSFILSFTLSLKLEIYQTWGIAIRFSVSICLPVLLPHVPGLCPEDIFWNTQTSETILDRLVHQKLECLAQKMCCYYCSWWMDWLIKWWIVWPKMNWLTNWWIDWLTSSWMGWLTNWWMGCLTSWSFDGWVDCVQSGVGAHEISISAHQWPGVQLLHHRTSALQVSLTLSSCLSAVLVPTHVPYLTSDFSPDE